MIWRRFGVWGALVSVVWLAAPAPASAKLAVPRHTALAIDRAGVLSAAERQHLSNALQRFQRDHGPQMQLLIIPSLEGEPIEEYSMRVVEAWKLGDAKRDDGVLFLVAMQDRRMRIEVGQGLEGKLPDIVCGRIIRNTVTPYFKQGQFPAGIVAGLNAIAQELGGPLQGAPSVPRQRTRRRGASLLGTLLYVAIVGLFLFPYFLPWGRRRGGFYGGYYGGRGGFGGGSFGGGFGGGGGGGFSGGGASGGW